MYKSFNFTKFGFLTLFFFYGCGVDYKKINSTIASAASEFLLKHPGFLIQSLDVPAAAQSSVLTSLCRAPRTDEEGPTNIVNYYCPPATSALASSKSGGARNTSEIDTIVLHNTEEGFSDAVRIFAQNAAKRVSIHFIVARDGTVVRNIKDSVMAYHAGNSTTNRSSIGIEIEASINNPSASIHAGGMTKAQYHSLSQLVIYLKNQYGVSARKLLPHRAVISGTRCPSSIWGEGSTDFFDEWKKVAFPN